MKAPGDVNELPIKVSLLITDVHSNTASADRILHRDTHTDMCTYLNGRGKHSRCTGDPGDSVSQLLMNPASSCLSSCLGKQLLCLVLSTPSSCRGSLNFFFHKIWSGTELLLLVKMGGSSWGAAAPVNWGDCSPAPWPALLALPTSSARRCHCEQPGGVIRELTWMEIDDIFSSGVAVA